MKLLIISHTEHYKDVNGKIVGWGPTLTEINFLALLFDEIYHFAVFKDVEAPKSALPYTSDRIHFIPMNPTGGEHLYQKFDILWNAPATILKVFKLLKKVDVFQLRAPTGIGVYLIPILTLFTKKKGWYKYAGNWVQINAPFGYALQRWFLKRQHRKVTINGKWAQQPEQCLTFENPCLTEGQQKEGSVLIGNKKFEKPYIFCFAGRLEDAKGVTRILEAFELIKDKKNVKEIHFVGDGVKMNKYKEMAKNMDIHVVFHGFLSFYEVFEIYKKAHFFLLPSSASEGFPKVIAEAMNFGCIPIVSDVSAIGQYVKQNINGYIVNPNSSENLAGIINQILEVDENIFYNMIENNFKVSKMFTYERYVDRINNDILNSYSE